MDVGRDLTDVAAQITADLGKESIKTLGVITGKSAQIVLETLFEQLKKRSNLDKPGETNLKKLLNSNANLKMVDMELKDVEVFAEKAKKFGLTYAVVTDDNKSHIIFKDENSDFIKRIFEIMIDKKLINKPKDFDTKDDQSTEKPKAKLDKNNELEKNNTITNPEKQDLTAKPENNDKQADSISNVALTTASKEEKNELITVVEKVATTLEKDPPKNIANVEKGAKINSPEMINNTELINSAAPTTKKAKSSSKDFTR